MEVYAFHSAVLSKNLEAVETLLKQPLEDIQPLINRLDRHGKTPLGVAVKNNCEAICVALLGCSAININRGTGGRTPLYDAAGEGYKKIVELLLMHPKILVNYQNYEGRTPLYIAVAHNHIEVVKLLLGHPKIDINQGKNEYTPLYAADRHDRASVLNLLLLHGVTTHAALISYNRVDRTRKHLIEAFNDVFKLTLLPEEQAGVSQFFLCLMRQPHGFDLGVPQDSQLPPIGEIKEGVDRVNSLIAACKLKEETVSTILFAVSFYYPQLRLFLEKYLTHDWITPFPLNQLPRIDWDRLRLRDNEQDTHSIRSCRGY